MKNALIVAALLAAGLAVFYGVAYAGSPDLARYVDDDTKIFWFVHTSNIHIGNSSEQDTKYLN